MSKAITYQCPNCHGVLAFNADSGLLECASCGSAFGHGEAGKAIPISAETQARKTQHVKTVDQFLDNAPWEIEHEGTAAAKTAIRYSCPSCGAGVIADQSTVSTSCPYCGNNMLTSGIAAADSIPDRILPFSITREQAEAQMRSHFKHRWYLSRKFNASIEHMQAVYVPYHLYDVNVDGWAHYVAYDQKGSGEGCVKQFYGFKRAGHAAFERIPIDGSSKMPDAHMDAIAPFDLSAMRAFSTAYAAGYLMEVADESAEACRPRAEKLAKASFEQDMENDVTDQPAIDGIADVVARETHVETVRMQSCVLPVWLMHCTWGAERMLFAVNGETGKCVGDLPISKARRRATVLVLAALLAVVVFWVLGAMTDGWRDADGLGFLVGLGIAVVALVPMAVDSHFKNQMKTAVEATDAGMSYDNQGLVFTERWQTEEHYELESQVREKLKEPSESGSGDLTR